MRLELEAQFDGRAHGQAVVSALPHRHHLGCMPRAPRSSVQGEWRGDTRRGPVGPALAPHPSVSGRKKASRGRGPSLHPSSHGWQLRLMNQRCVCLPGDEASRCGHWQLRALNSSAQPWPLRADPSAPVDPSITASGTLISLPRLLRGETGDFHRLHRRKPLAC